MSNLESKLEELFYRPLSEREKRLMREAFYHGVLTGIVRYINDPDPSGMGLIAETQSGLDQTNHSQIPEDGESWKHS